MSPRNVESTGAVVLYTPRIHFGLCMLAKDLLFHLLEFDPYSSNRHWAAMLAIIALQGRN